MCTLYTSKLRARVLMPIPSHNTGYSWLFMKVVKQIDSVLLIQSL